MSDRPLLVTSSSAVAGILSGGIIVGSLLFGAFATLGLIAVLGIRPFWFAAILGVGGCAAVFSYLSYRGAKGSEVRFYEEGLEAAANTGGGAGFAAFTDREIPYEGIDLVIRDDELGDGLFGTGTFELVVPGAGTVRLPYLEHPDQAHRILNERVPEPDELRRRVEHGELDRDSYLWAYWDDDHYVPEAPVVDADAFDEMAAFDVHDATPGAVRELGEVSEAVGFGGGGGGE